MHTDTYSEPQALQQVKTPTHSEPAYIVRGECGQVVGFVVKPSAHSLFFDLYDWASSSWRSVGISHEKHRLWIYSELAFESQEEFDIESAERLDPVKASDENPMELVAV